jgi:hypothetical protein
MLCQQKTSRRSRQSGRSSDARAGWGANGGVDALIQRGLGMAWTALFGTVSVELFDQLHNVVGERPDDREPFFSECVRRWAEQIGLT